MKEIKPEGYEKIMLSEGIYLMLVPKENYKSNVITVYIKRPLIREEATLNSLLPSVMRSATESYPTPMDLAKRLQSLYGSTIGVSVSKMGERHILAFRMSTVADCYLPEPIFGEILEVFREILFSPKVQEGGFLPEYMAIEKEILEEDIRSKINDKGRYALDRCIEIMCENEPYGISEDGYIEDLDQIDGKKLYEHYRKILANSPIDIVVAGNFEKQEVIEKIREIFSFPREQILEIPVEQRNDVPSEKNVTEKMAVTQGKLIMGYRTPVDLLHEDYYAMVLYSAVLGGGPHSKLFLNVREKHSLCYSIYSSLEKFKGLMLVNAGIEISDYDRAQQLIREQMQDMKEGRISEEELSHAKKYMINSLLSLKDSVHALTDFYYNQSLRDKKITLDEMARKIEDVECEDIVRVAQDIVPDTVYFLTAE